MTDRSSTFVLYFLIDDADVPEVHAASPPGVTHLWR